MSDIIESNYDAEITTFIIRMPDFISLEMLTAMQQDLLVKLPRLTVSGQIKLLIDTNKHEFESIGCLKRLREILQDERINKYISKCAFISPPAYAGPEVISQTLGYFNSYSRAYSWLADKGD